jgi:L-amino acid N-acyltransferase YncA
MTIGGVADGVVRSTLRDGATVVLRPLDPSDIDAVATLHRTLSDRETYSRFFTSHPVSLKILADRLTDCDDGNLSLGAFEAGQLIGVANYALCGKPATADVAVVIAHEDHLRGVGTVLLRRLAEIARENGIRHLVADILASNDAMFRVLHDAGLHPQHKDYACGVVHLDIDLDDISL